MALVIKKTVDLSELGEEYKGIRLLFKSIPAYKLPELAKKQEEVGEDTTKALPLIIEILKGQFIEGKQDETEIKPEDLRELDADSLVYCFQLLTGQGIDPKVSSESTTTSSTEADTAPKS